ncbi:MAG: hypothetical protein KDD85_12275 [Parvularculaceae bacterium]|nr:hypothetical protein [Parvularculaceae bacterium]
MNAMLIVSSLVGAADAYRKYEAARVISLLSEEEEAPDFDGLDSNRHLLLYVDRESCAQTINKAARARARDIIDFVSRWDGGGDILIHCNRGVARSTAAAYIIMCMREPETAEESLAQRLRKAAPHADPCPLLVTYADEILDRDGRMADAIDDLCAPCPTISAPVAIVSLAT